VNTTPALLFRDSEQDPITLSFTSSGQSMPQCSLTVDDNRA